MLWVVHGPCFIGCLVRPGALTWHAWNGWNL
jgi:hypothetical protein